MSSFAVETPYTYAPARSSANPAQGEAVLWTATPEQPLDAAGQLHIGTGHSLVPAITGPPAGFNELLQQEYMETPTLVDRASSMPYNEGGKPDRRPQLLRDIVSAEPMVRPPTAPETVVLPFDSLVDYRTKYALEGVLSQADTAYWGFDAGTGDVAYALGALLPNPSYVLDVVDRGYPFFRRGERMTSDLIRMARGFSGGKLVPEGGTVIMVPIYGQVTALLSPAFLTNNMSPSAPVVLEEQIHQRYQQEQEQLEQLRQANSQLSARGRESVSGTTATSRDISGTAPYRQLPSEAQMIPDSQALSYRATREQQTSQPPQRESIFARLRRWWEDPVMLMANARSG